MQSKSLRMSLNVLFKIYLVSVRQVPFLKQNSLHVRLYFPNYSIDWNTTNFNLCFIYSSSAYKSRWSLTVWILNCSLKVLNNFDNAPLLKICLDVLHDLVRRWHLLMHVLIPTFCEDGSLKSHSTLMKSPDIQKMWILHVHNFQIFRRLWNCVVVCKKGFSQ